MRSREENRRVFGQDITNIERRLSKHVLQEKNTSRADLKIRSRSLNPKKEKEIKKDAIIEYETDIIQFIFSLQVSKGLCRNMRRMNAKVM